MEFLLIALLTLLNGAFAMSEMALASSRKARLSAMAESGDKGALAALALLDNPTRFLSSVQVGITSIGMLNGIIGEAAFSDELSAWLLGMGMPDKAASLVATGIVVVVITYVTIVFGELVPKRIGQMYPESVARWVSRPMTWVARIAGPFVRLLSLSTQGVLKALQLDDDAAARQVTEEELSASLDEGLDAGVIEEHERQMVQNLFRLDDRPLTSLMTPRSDVDWLDAKHTVASALKTLAEGANQYGIHSWYPVCRGTMDEVVGLISMAQLLGTPADDPRTLDQLAQAASFLPETLTGMELLEQLRARQGRVAFVVDEYGVVQGIMTPGDLLEAITGELRPDASADAWATQRDDGTWLLDGMMPIDELKTRLDIKALPDEDRGRYNTLAGLLMSVSGHLPATAERIDCAGWRFEVVDLDGRRIDKCLASPLDAEPANPS